MKIVAHRGMGQGFLDPDGPPENTLPAFEAGWAVADACELDAHLTSDGEVIVIHDATTDRTTNASWIVSERTAAELQSLDAGRWKGEQWAGTRLPLLSEVLAMIPEGKQLYIELKAGPQIAAPAVKAIRDSGKGPAQLVVMSFDIDTIAAVKAALPDFQCLFLVTFAPDYSLGGWRVDPEAYVQLVRKHHLDGLGPGFAMPPSLPRLLADAGLKLVTWTVNDPQIARELEEMGVEAITTDRPKALSAAFSPAPRSSAPRQ